MTEYKLTEQILDAQEVSRLRKLAGWNTLPDDIQQAALDNSLFFAAVFSDSRPVAMGRVVGDGHQYFYLQDILVDPQHAGRGLGTMLTNHLVGKVKEAANKGAFFGLMAAEGLAAFYERFGFKDRGASRPGMELWVD
jgi:ribosomal protein S18 acetylase RimI-like enzyme